MNFSSHINPFKGTPRIEEKKSNKTEKSASKEKSELAIVSKEKNVPSERNVSH